MANAPAVQIPINLKTGKAQRDAKAFAGAFRKSITPVIDVGHLATAALSGIARGLKSAVGEMAGWVKMAQEGDLATRKLNNAMSLRGRLTEENRKAMNALSAELKQSIGLGDVEVRNLAARLSLLGVTNDKLGDAVRATIGLSEATGQKLGPAGILMGKVLSGNTSALKRYGFAANSAADAMRKLLPLYDQAAANAKGFDGDLRRLTTVWGEFREELGRAVTSSSGLGEAMGAIKDALLEFTRILGTGHGRTAVDTFFRGLSWHISQGIRGFLALRQAASELVNSKFMRVTDKALGGSGAGHVLPEVRRARFRAQALSRVGLEADMGMVDAEFARRHPESAASAEMIAALKRLAGALENAGARAPNTRGSSNFFGGGGGGGGAGGGVGASDFDNEQFAQMGAFAEAMAANNSVMDGLRQQELDAKQQWSAEMADLDLARMRGETEIANQRNALHQRAFELGVELRAKELKEMKKELGAHEQFAAFRLNIARQMAGALVSGMVSMIGQMIESAMGGEKAMDLIFAKMMGKLMMHMGAMLVQTGMTAIWNGIVGTNSPAMAATHGRENAIVAGAGAMAAGVTMIAGGAAISGAASAGMRQRQAPRSGGFSGGGGGGGGFDTNLGSPAFSGAGSGGGSTTVFNLSFDNVLPGSERRIAGEIERLLERGK